MTTKRLLTALTLAFSLLSIVCRSQVITFQSAGFAGTTTAPAGTTTKTSMSAGGVVSQAPGQSNRAGFMWGNVDYRPNQQATGITFSSITNNSLTLTWTKGNGSRRIVVGKSGSAVNATVASATAYTASAAFGSGTQISAGNFVVYEGTGNSVTVTNLNPSVTYHFKVFEYNGKYGAINANIEYQTNDGANNPLSHVTLANQPSSNATGFITSANANDQMTIQWANGNGGTRVVIMKAATAVDATPVDGNAYTANTIFGSGSQLGTGNFVVFAGSGNAVTITGLQPNVTYFYQIFELNGSGVDNNYLTPGAGTSQLTLLPAPVATAATPAQLSFTANWQAVTAATGYFLDVSTDGAFSSLVAGYSNKAIASTDLSAVVSGLTGGTFYYYRVRSKNAAGSSLSSNTIQVTTIPTTPTITTPTSLDSVGFTANWNATTLTTSYFLDVATDAGFTQLVSGFNNKEVTGTSVAITGLEPGTNYFLRVKAENASGASPYSAPYTQITKTWAPITKKVETVTSNKFVAEWYGARGASTYEIDVSDDNFVSSIPGYPQSVASTSVQVSSLNPETIYSFRVRGVNAAGVSAWSEQRNTATTNGSGQQTNLPQISGHPIADGKVTADISGGTGPYKVFLKHRPISTEDFQIVEILAGKDATSVEFDIEDNWEVEWADELGMEYHFVITDLPERSDSTAATYVYKTLNNEPISSLETGADSYKMFSIPAEVSSKDIEEILKPVFAKYGGYDKSKWRLFHYEENQFIEYGAGLTSLEPGSSYWMIGDDPSLNIPVTAPVVHANQSDPFTITFAEGWNQIASPFPFNIDWSEVQVLNTNVGLNSAWTHNGSIYVKTNVLKPWAGAFVYADHTGSVRIPVTSKTTESGRVAAIGSDPDEEEWQLPIELTLGKLKQVSALGMHPLAEISKDRFDEIELPRFDQYLELSTSHKEFRSTWFMIDMVPTTHSYEWKFKAESNSDQPEATISWDLDAISKSASGLMLVDVESSTWIDMKVTGSYSFPWRSGKEFIVAYNRIGEAIPSLTFAGLAYPNPFKDRVTIPILNAIDNNEVTVHVYDLLGRKVRSLSHTIKNRGEDKISWDGRDDGGNEVAAGMLLYRLQYGEVISKAQRIIKE